MIIKNTNSKILAISITTLLVIILFSEINPTKSSYSYQDLDKPMEFYFHYLDEPVRVAGLETKYVINTMQTFRFLTQQEAYVNAFYKPVGLPKISVNFYLHPNFAAPITVDGTWQAFVWVNGSAYKPATFIIQFKEITLGGTVLWDSGSINPVVTSSIGNYVDVPIHNYNLSTTLTHTFNHDTTLLVTIEINAGSSAKTRIWYDSPLYPSKAIIPAKDYARPVEIKTYAYDNTETNLFYYNWSQNERVVIVRTNVSDPLGGYDIRSVRLTILDPSDNPVLDNAEMIRKSNGQWLTSFSHTYEAKWSYPSTIQLGNYTVKVTVIDNNGYYHNQETGSFEPFIEEGTYMFTIGVIVFYDPVLMVVDDIGNPLPDAQVYIDWPNGSRDALPRYTSINGLINLTNVLPANYEFTVLWKDRVVNNTAIYLDSNGPFIIRTKVYQLTLSVLDNTQNPIHGSYVMVYTQAGIGYGLDITDESGQAIFRLPEGEYEIEVYYSTEYWLSVIDTSEIKSESINSSTSKTLVLTEFPPVLWSTNGFWLLVALITVSVFIVVYVFFIRRKHKL